MNVNKTFVGMPSVDAVLDLLDRERLDILHWSGFQFAILSSNGERRHECGVQRNTH